MQLPWPSRGRRRTGLRSAARVVRDGRPAPHDHDADPELLALVEEPYGEPAETHRRLTALREAFEARDDRRAVFLDVYARMTGRVADGVRRGAFVDPDWVGDYLVAFANLYRTALRDYERGAMAAVADPWQVAFEVAEAGDALVLQDAMLGINAHINYDLALALSDVGLGPDRATRREDHDAIIDVIDGLVDDVQGVLAERDAAGIATVDESLGRIDEWLSVRTIDECRDSAWRTAVALNSRLRARRRLARWINDVTATGAAYLIASTRASDTVHGALDDLESTLGEET